MSVVLIRPRNESLPRGVVSTQYPINIGYLASWLKNNGVGVTMFDFEVQDIDEDKLIEAVKGISPALIGISCMTSNITAGHRVASFLKKSFPCLKIVVGGVHSTAIPKKTLEEFPSFDIVVKGEGEITLLELYKAVAYDGDLSKVKGLVYRGSGAEIIETENRELIEDLDLLPFPDRDLLKLDLYKRTHTSRAFSRLSKNISEILTARGCPYNCNFCASKVTFGRRVRYRSVENITGEMQECISRYGTNHFSILDDTFTFNKEVFYPVCDYLKTKKATWDCFTRADRVDEEMLRKAVNSGCEKISFGIESGSEKILRFIGKGITVDQAKEAFRLCKKVRLRYTEATFMLGNHPEETMDDINLTLSLIREIEPDFIAFSITCPFPGTDLNRLMKEGGYIGRENWDDFVLFGGTPSWRYAYLNVSDLKRIQTDFMRRFYTRPRYIFKELMKVKSPRELSYWANIARDMLKSFL